MLNSSHWLHRLFIIGYSSGVSCWLWIQDVLLMGHVSLYYYVGFCMHCHWVYHFFDMQVLNASGIGSVRLRQRILMAVMNATLLFCWLYAHYYYCFLALCSFFLGFGFIYYYRWLFFCIIPFSSSVFLCFFEAYLFFFTLSGCAYHWSSAITRFRD